MVGSGVFRLCYNIFVYDLIEMLLVYYSGPLSQDSNAVSLSRTFDFTRSGTALPRFCF